MSRGSAPRQATRGFTIVEMMIVVAVLAVLAVVTLPAVKGYTLRAGRIDAVDALTRIQSRQEQYRARHGMYATELSALRGTSAVSNRGLYAVSIERREPEAFVATATAMGHQADDSDCPALTLRVQQGFPTEGPAPACWRR